MWRKLKSACQLITKVKSPDNTLVPLDLIETDFPLILINVHVPMVTTSFSSQRFSWQRHSHTKIHASVFPLTPYPNGQANAHGLLIPLTTVISAFALQRFQRCITKSDRLVGKTPAVRGMSKEKRI